jgi:CO/xanthine dehydrogenase FAD-binding subunit
MARKAEWEKLKERALKRFGEESVFGEGSLNSRLALVGEAPGKHEVEEGKVVTARIALANAADRPLRARRAEESLLGRSPGTEVFAEAGRRAAQEADPRPEPHAGVAYRRQTIKVLVQRALHQALTEITERA